MPINLLETDQIRCYAPSGREVPCENSGQDAAYPKSGPRLDQNRFEVLGNVVADNLTGAIWRKDANPAEFPLSWREAMQFVADMETRRDYGYFHWQLPSRDILFSLISHQHINPVLPEGHPFDNVFNGYYWTQDTCRRLNNQAWYIHLGGSRVQRGMKHGSYMVWPVCVDHLKTNVVDDEPGNRFRINDTGGYDIHTGLVWCRKADLAGAPLAWQDALELVRSFNRKKLGGHQDWRLPNIRELQSLVDLQCHSPALPTGHPFTNVRDVYWSSTTSVYEPGYAWALYFQDGAVGVGFKPRKTYHLWPVRNGISQNEAGIQDFF